MNLAIKNTDMTAMNDLLLAFGRFDVKHGEFTVYSQLGVKDGQHQRVREADVQRPHRLRLVPGQA